VSEKVLYRPNAGEKPEQPQSKRKPAVTVTMQTICRNGGKTAAREEIKRGQWSKGFEGRKYTV